VSGTGPLRAVLSALEDGAPSLQDVCVRTRLDREVVDAAVEHLIRMGRVSAHQLAIGCPGGGCGSCASGVEGSPGCGAQGPSGSRSGPVLVSLSVRRAS
jgi:hypothetical protein